MKEYKVGDRIRLAKSLGIKFPDKVLRILEIDEYNGKYRIGRSENFGSIWLNRDWIK